MRIRDIEVDEDIAREIDLLLVSMDEFAIQATRAYFKTGSVSEAAKLLVKIGVTNCNGKKVSQDGVKTVLQREHSQALLGLLRRALSQHTIRDAVWAEHQYAKILERCLEPVPVTDREGIFTGVFEFDATNANRAVENIVKLKGLGAAEKNASKGGDALAAIAGILGRIDTGVPPASGG